MNTEKKKSNSKNKITPFRIPGATLEDPMMDQLIQQSLTEDVDKLEEELQRDPLLKDVCAPEDMFGKIVAQLKAQGIWQEETERETRTEEESARKSGKLDVKEQEEQEARSTGKPVNDGTGSQYQILSAEDCEAMELGRQFLRQREKKKRRSKQMWKVLRRAGATAAAIGLVFGLSMTSEANRKLVGKIWDSAMESFGLRMPMNVANEEEIVRSKSKEEVQAMKEIREKTGILPVEFGYLPEGMRYIQYDVQDNGTRAILQYSDGTAIFSAIMDNTDQEKSSYYIWDNTAVLSKTIRTDQNISVEIWATNSDSEEESYMAKFEYDESRYVLTGIFSLKDIEEIVKGIYFF